MRIARVFLLLWLPLACLGIARAEDVKTKPSLLGAAVSTGGGTKTLGDVITQYANDKGISIVVDSRLLADRSSRPIRSAAPPLIALKRHLRPLGLRVDSVDDKTFAIAAANLAPTSKIQADTPTRAGKDVIVVSATMAGYDNTVDRRTLFTLDRAALQSLAPAQTSDATYRLPQSLATLSPANTVFEGASGGLSLADLRGLGVERTMVLVNGRRRTPMPGGRNAILGFDLDTLPSAFLERIELSNRTGGASIGVDAVSGTLNFVLRREVETSEVGARFGLSQSGDAEEYSAHLLHGFETAGAEVSVGAQYFSRNGLIGADRDLTSESYGYVRRGEGFEFLPGAGGSAITTRPELAGILSLTGTFSSLRGRGPRTRTDGAGGLETYNGSPNQRYNWVADTTTHPEAERAFAFAHLRRPLGESIEFFGEAHLAHAATQIDQAPIIATNSIGSDPVIGFATAIPINNPTLPDRFREFATSIFGVDIDRIVVSRRFAELGPRRRDVNRSASDVLIGAKIDHSTNAVTELAYRFGRSAVSTEQFNLVDGDRLAIAIDPVLCREFAGCQPLDLFVDSGVSPDAADFLRLAPLTRTVRLAEHEVSAVHRNDANLLGAKALSEMGAIFRRSSAFDKDTSQPGLNTIGALSDNNYTGREETAEFYSSVSFQSATQAEMISSLGLSLNGRVSVSSLRDTAHAGEVSGFWSPVRSVEVFAGLAAGERPPNIIELSFVGRTGQSFFQDPCLQSTAPGCDADAVLGVSANFKQTQFLLEQTNFGNPDLANERYGAFHFGARLSPPPHPRFGRFSASLQWTDYRIRDVIGSPQDLIELCFGHSEAAIPNCAVNPLTGENAIRRDPMTEQLLSVDTALTNNSALSWRGLDLEVQHIHTPRGNGIFESLWFRGMHTYTDHVSKTIDGAGRENLRGLADYPKHRSLILFGAEFSRVSTAFTLTRRGRIETTREPFSETKTGPHMVLGANLRFALTTRAEVSLAIENLTNRDAPLLAFSDGPNTLPAYYDILGRRFAVAVRASL